MPGDAPFPSWRNRKRRQRRKVALWSSVIAVSVVVLCSSPRRDVAAINTKLRGSMRPTAGIEEAGVVVPQEGRVSAVPGVGLASIIGALGSNQTSVAIGSFVADAGFEDPQNWKVKIRDGTRPPVVVVSKKMLKDGQHFVLNFDSEHSKLALPMRLKRIHFGVAGKEKELSQANWSLDVEGHRLNHISVASEAGSLMYDGSVGVELPEKDGFRLQYAAGVRRGHIQDGPKFNPFASKLDFLPLKPDHIWHGLGLKHISTFGDARLKVTQSNVDGGIPDIYADLKREGRPGTNADYAVRASLKDWQQMYSATAKARSRRKGLNGTIHMDVVEGKPTFRGVGDLQLATGVAPGVEVRASTSRGVNESTDWNGLVPVNFGLSLDLATFLPRFMNRGSELNARATYEDQNVTPSDWIGSLVVKPNVGPRLGVEATFAVDKNVGPSVGVTFHGSVGDFDVDYKGSTANYTQDGQVVYRPANRMVQLAKAFDSVGLQTPLDYEVLSRSGASAFAHLTQNPLEQNGNPRLQFGLQLENNREAAPRGRTVFFDSGFDSDTLDAGSAAVTKAR